MARNRVEGHLACLVPQGKREEIRGDRFQGVESRVGVARAGLTDFCRWTRLVCRELRPGSPALRRALSAQGRFC